MDTVTFVLPGVWQSFLLGVFTMLGMVTTLGCVAAVYFAVSHD